MAKGVLIRVRRGSGERLWPLPAHPIVSAFLTHYQSQHSLPGLVAEALTLVDRCLTGLSRESAHGRAQELEGGLVKPREAPPLEICTGQRLYALQPYGKRCGLRQRFHRIIRDNAAFLRAPRMLKVIIAGTACQLRPWLRLHDQGHHIGRHPAGKQVGVSGIWKQGELHSRRHL